MTKLLLPIICLLLSGCIYQVANNTDLEKAIYVCGDLENIDNITITFAGNEKVICKDGLGLFLDNVKLPRKGETK